MSVALQFLWSVLLSLGLSVSADNVGDTFSTIYANQDPATQQRIDIIMRDPALAATIGAIEFTTDAYMYCQGIDPDNPVIDNHLIQESIGIDGWKNFLNQHQGNVLTNPDFPSFSCGEYSFEYGVDFYLDGSIWCVEPYVDVYQNGSLYLPISSRSHSLYGYCYCVSGLDDYYKNQAVEYYDAVRSSLFYDPSQKAVRFLGTDKYSAFSIDLSLFINDDIVPDTLPADIGEAGDYPISADGTITLPDGTVITPNADGTYTINGNVYSPSYNIGAYDDTALLDLLNQILQRISDLENSLTFEEELETEEELDETQEEALENVQSYDGTMSEFLFSSPKWTTVFPFCIPWDFVRGVKLLSAAPVAPRFEIPFEIPSFGQFPGYNTVITLDLSEYDQYFVPVRWFSTMFFLIGLGFITFKIVKGAT